MMKQPKYQLEMYWILDDGCLRSAWIASRPQPFDTDLEHPAVPQLKKQAA